MKKRSSSEHSSTEFRGGLVRMDDFTKFIVPGSRPNEEDMKTRAVPTPTVTMSVVISHTTYHALHELRLARCRQGTKMPTLAALLREALDGYIAQTAVSGCSRATGAR